MDDGDFESGEARIAKEERKLHLREAQPDMRV